MGCGKSKHDVASDNTLQRKKSSDAGQKNGTETIDINVDNIVSSEVEQNSNENVKDVGVGGTVDESNDVKDKSLEVKENKALEERSKNAEEKASENVVAKEPEGEKDDSLKENHAPPPAAKEEKKPENQKKEEETKDMVQKDTLTKGETKDTKQEEKLSKQEQETKDTNQEKTLANKEVEAKEKIVPTSAGEEKDLKAKLGK
ncbi:hypothetical protein Lalb_Chr12g0196481 [Lupinus albus]|uniref:Uncharacterized protein n=1 Tax=Lupinus albus TaxID=3870 RepID=A0A6A4PKV9_LUPAL|nr:hypothetical protein Lalb_Chr12g0196481 [Lupinus albus]